MYNQGVIPLAAHPLADRRAWIGWALCSLFPAVFLFLLFALTSLSAPEHDDFCFADLYARHGFIHTVWIYYHTQSGRILALWLTQVPPALSAATGVSLLSAYSLTMAVSAALFLAATALAMVRAWPAPQLSNWSSSHSHSQVRYSARRRVCGICSIGCRP